MTGASGYVGQGVVRELISAGHRVTGLARSPAGAARIEALGARAVAGTLDEPAAVADLARAAEGVAHLGYKTDDTTDLAGSGRADAAVIAAIGDALAGTGKPLVTTSGTLLVGAAGSLATERLAADFRTPLGAARGPSEEATLALADRGVRSAVVRLAPTVHSDADVRGFVSTLIGVARRAGVSGYVGDGEQRWPSVHRADAAVLYRLALEHAPAGTRLHGVAEQGVRIREIAEAIGQLVGVPTASVPAERAADHFGWLGHLVQLDNPVSSEATRELLGWHPDQPSLIDEIGGGAYDGLLSVANRR
ncbi:SDR family oxidoreductase [Actinocatenispora thailandica]